MSKMETRDPWRQMRGVVDAVATSLRGGAFIEQILEALCIQLGASSAWSTLESKRGGRIHRSRSVSLGASPVELAKHVTETLEAVHETKQVVFGLVPYAKQGSFAGIPLWSHPSDEARRLLGAVYLEFPNDEATHDDVVGFLESIGALLGGVIVQQSRVEEARDDLRVERARDRNDHWMRLEEIIASPSMRPVRNELLAALDSNSSLMLLGESGTGKTLLATAFARSSGQEPIVRATLGHADDLNTITSELFGHERGAYSGAVSKRRGLVDYADGGTLILDEVLNLPAHAQQLLLDFTQFGTYRPLGFEGQKPKTAEVRLISVTNGDIEQAIENDRFREDLYYRLATVPVVLPPLRDRREDIPDIAEHYLASGAGRAPWTLSAAAVECLTSPRFEWRGNIRELEAVLERAKNRARRDGDQRLIDVQHLDVSCGATENSDDGSSNAGAISSPLEKKWRRLVGERERLDELEKDIIEEALEECQGVVLRAARELSVSRSGLLSRITTLKIDAKRYKPKRS